MVDAQKKHTRGWSLGESVCHRRLETNHCLSAGGLWSINMTLPLPRHVGFHCSNLSNRKLGRKDGNRIEKRSGCVNPPNSFVPMNDENATYAWNVNIDSIHHPVTVPVLITDPLTHRIVSKRRINAGRDGGNHPAHTKLLPDDSQNFAPANPAQAM